jgi:hypothetical protein
MNSIFPDDAAAKLHRKAARRHTSALHFAPGPSSYSEVNITHFRLMYSATTVMPDGFFSHF